MDIYLGSGRQSKSFVPSWPASHRPKTISAQLGAETFELSPSHQPHTHRQTDRQTDTCTPTRAHERLPVHNDAAASQGGREPTDGPGSKCNKTAAALRSQPHPSIHPSIQTIITAHIADKNRIDHPHTHTHTHSHTGRSAAVFPSRKKAPTHSSVTQSGVTAMPNLTTRSSTAS